MEVISRRICWWACVNIMKEFLDCYTVMHRLTMGVHSEKCVVRRFRGHANIIECLFSVHIVTFNFITNLMHLFN